MGAMRKVKRSFFHKKGWKKKVKRWGQMKIVAVVKKKESENESVKR